MNPSTTCLHPISVKFYKRFTDSDWSVDEFRKPHFLVVPCGHCIACKMRRTREWTLRLIMESKYWSPENIAFVTLTYNDDNLTYYVRDHRHREKSLYKRDVQNFFKRLRRRLPYRISHFSVGEMGERTHRPHYHSVIFGLRPNDWKLVDECWQKGFTLTKSWFKETCQYVAGYIQKKLFGRNAGYGLASPPFLLCSQHLGESYFLDNIETICKQGFIVNDGYKYPIPRVFVRKAIALGYLPEVDLDEIELRQQIILDDFLDWCTRNNIELSDYMKNFVLIREGQFKRSNFTRDNNEVV